MDSQKSNLPAVAVLLTVVGIAGGVTWWVKSNDPNSVTIDVIEQPVVDDAYRRVTVQDDLILWWDDISSEVRNASLPTDNRGSNIHPDDYVGPDACRKCHQKNYDDWSKHPHRWMNALATDETVKGDFSGVSIEYMGGTATFEQADETRQMVLARDDQVRTYDIRKTIGSRFFQYYIGRLVEGPEPESHPLRHTNQVLPFGYWLEPGEWVPIVHVGPEFPDEKRIDPFHVPVEPESGKDYYEYTLECSGCHTTFPLGDDYIRKHPVMARHVPGPSHWYAGAYVESTNPALLASTGLDTNEGLKALVADFCGREPEDHGVTFGISCEACHLGCREHAQNKSLMPDFHPRSPLLRVETRAQLESGRTHQNLNRACSRCHAGPRPEFANGSATWNSVEYEDAMKGSCYTELKCIDCHNPHQATGPKWSKTAEQDDQSCVRCHEQFTSRDAIEAHTHHSVGSEGARCMNCHMPRLNEGLQDVVRTHTIFSPTDEKMIESNHPNACNMCHTDRSIDWTLQYLKEWYGREYSATKIADAYRDRDGSVAVGWLNSDTEGVRLVAADAICRANDRDALSSVIEALDDPHLTNRQFARIGLERMLDIKLTDFGYRFYMMKDERQTPLKRLREHLLPGAGE